MEEPPVPDRLTVRLGADATVLIASDLHLEQTPTRASRLIERDLVARLSGWPGPGALVLNGDTFELWGEPEGTVAGALDAHPALTAAIRAFADRLDREVVVVVGNHDGALAWDDLAAETVAKRLGARCALSADLVFDTPAGTRVVRCEHGHAYDPTNRFVDPRNPLDSPLGQHIVQEVLPEVKRSVLLADIAALAEPNAVGQFIASRLVYRQLGRHVWWLSAPLVLGLLLRTPVTVRLLAGSAGLGRLERWMLFAGVGLVAEAVLLLLLAGLVARLLYGALAGSRLGPAGSRLNATPKAAAAALLAQPASGLVGLVTSHTHQPELAAIGRGFYANTGGGVRSVEQRPARWFLPPVFVAILRRSWVELDVEREVRARLVVAETPAGEATWLERLVTAPDELRPATPRPTAPEVVAAFPGPAGWPVQQRTLAARPRTLQVRRMAALLVVAIALLGVASAITPPFRHRFAALLEVLPVAAPQGAATGVIFVSAALLLVAFGLSRGRSLAWAIAVTLLAASAVLHLLKGLDVEEAVLALLVAGWLTRHRSAFPTHPDHRQARRAVVVLVIGGALVAAVSIGLVAITGVKAGDRRSAAAIAGRLAGRHALALRATPLTSPVFAAIGLCLLLLLGWVLLGPRSLPRATAADRQADLARARRIVAAHGGDTLSYFALRSDKSWFFTGDCVVAYGVRDGVCLVSPDPIGPPEQHAEAWAQFTAFADRHGWPVTVVGATDGWLPIYRAAGLRPVYLGDEAIVDCSTFTLEGRAVKSLRSGYHRVKRAGYTVRFYDPAMLSFDLMAQLRTVATESRQGATERGFSMTLSRLGDPEDTGLLLAVAHGPDGRVAGFCQYIPAPDITGWSLDLMRRSTTQPVPNGLTDFVIIETIHHLKARGEWGLALNFAVMRGVLAGERGDGRLSDLQRKLLHRFSDGTQMESLWRYNDKYRPLWRPRYVVLSGLSTVPLQGLAVAGAEGVTLRAGAGKP